MTEPTRKSLMQVYDAPPTPQQPRRRRRLPGERLDAFAASRGAFEALVATLAGAETAGWTHDQLQDHLDIQGREALRLLYQDHLDLRAMREQHAIRHAHATGQQVAIVDADGIGHRKVEPGHHRQLATVFGTVQVTRCAFRADGARNLYPADAVLNLPDHLHSHTLQRHAATEAVRGSFQAAEQALTRHCGKVAGTRQVQQLTLAAATDIDAFYQTSAPMPSSDDTLLVLSVDGKGVVMRPEALRDQTRKAAAKGANRYQTRLASGEKQGRKRMATLGTVYDATPAPRRPHDAITRPPASTPPLPPAPAAAAAAAAAAAVGGGAAGRPPPPSGSPGRSPPPAPSRRPGVRPSRAA